MSEDNESLGAKRKRIIFLLGGPCVGKTIQCQWLCSKFNLRSFATGDILKGLTLDNEEKSNIFNQLELSCDKEQFLSQLRTSIQKKDLVQDNDVFTILKSEIERSDKQCFVIEGYPRTIKEAELFENYIKPDGIIYLKADEQCLLNRLKKRYELIDAEFKQDEEKLRIDKFFNQMAELSSHYELSKIISEVDGSRSIDTVRADILYELRNHWYIPHLEEEPALVPKQAFLPQSKCCLLV